MLGLALSQEFQAVVLGTGNDAAFHVTHAVNMLQRFQETESAAKNVG